MLRARPSSAHPVPGETEPTPPQPGPTRRARPMSETTQQAYVRGVEMGKIVIRLDHHDEQIDATNALLARTVDISQTMASTVQTLTQTIVSDAATRVAVAEAVKDAEDTQDAHSRAKW